MMAPSSGPLSARNCSSVRILSVIRTVHYPSDQYNHYAKVSVLLNVIWTSVASNRFTACAVESSRWSGPSQLKPGSHKEDCEKLEAKAWV